MALIKCNNCGKMISNQLMACPHCGAPVTDANTPFQPQGQMAQQGDAPYRYVNPATKPAKKISPALIALIAGLALVVLAIAGFAVYKFVAEPRTTTESPWDLPDDDADDTFVNAQASHESDSRVTKAEEKEADAVVEENYEWLSHRYATMSDIAGKSSSELRIMRNSVFARHGRYFKDPELRAYFNSQSWYEPYRDEVPTAELNDYEKKNVEFLKSHE